MNKANYTEKNSFPLSTQGLDFIQQQILLAAEYAGAAGGNYILSGCQENGQTVAAGVLVVEGEIIPFKGGTKHTTVRIVETKEQITAGSETYFDAYTKRHVEFGANLSNVDTFAWDEFTAFPTNKFLLENSATKAELALLQNYAMPKGGIIMWSGQPHTIPTGFALCDGSTVNGVATPDLRGRFIIGYYPGKANTPTDNPGVTVENYGQIGNKGGQMGVTLTKNQMPKHNHLNYVGEQVPLGGFGLMRRPAGSESVTPTTADSGAWQTEPDIKHAPYNIPYEGENQSHENRPPYYVLAFIIKTV